MSKYDLNSWEEFHSKIMAIKSKYCGDTILYRGGDADEENKHLKTSLERFSKKTWTVKKYIRLSMQCVTQIEAYTGKMFNLPTWNNFEIEFDNNCLTDNTNFFSTFPQLYSYLIYLRQHGFPSPLLDWSASPYIAAYFAFAEKEINQVGKKAIFIYVEHPQGVKTYWPGNGVITRFGPNINTHKRHFLQQAWYTVALKKLNPDQKDWEFANHSKFFEEYIEGEDDGNQDILIKITIPKSERIKVLSYLDEHNLNQFSLFETEEGLMKTIAFREIETVDDAKPVGLN